MESFAEQLKRHGSQFTQLHKQATKMLKLVIQFVQTSATLAQMFSNFGSTQFAFDRPIYDSLSKIMAGMTDHMQRVIPFLATAVGSLDCTAEVKTMQAIYTSQQKAKPPFNQQANIEFIENFTTYQQNRQKQLRNMVLSFSQYFLQQGGIQLQSAGTLYHLATAVDLTAPLIDTARRCVNIDIAGADLCDLCRISRRDFEHRSVGVSVQIPEQVGIQEIKSPVHSSPAPLSYLPQAVNYKQLMRSQNLPEPTGTKFDTVPALTPSAPRTDVAVGDSVRQIDGELEALEQQKRLLESKKDKLINHTAPDPHEHYDYDNFMQNRSNLLANALNQPQMQQYPYAHPLPQQQSQVHVPQHIPIDQSVPQQTIQQPQQLIKSQNEPLNALTPTEQDTNSIQQPVKQVEAPKQEPTKKPEAFTVNASPQQNQSKQPSRPQSQSVPSRSNSKPQKGHSSIFGKIYNDSDSEDEKVKKKPKKLDIDIDLGFDVPDEKPKYKKDDFNFL